MGKNLEQPVMYPEETKAELTEENTARKVDEVPAKPKLIEPIDRMELENLQIKVQNVQLQLQIMQQDLGKALNTRNELVEKMKKKRDEMLAKYGVDVSQIQINDDGTYQPIQRPGQ